MVDIYLDFAKAFDKVDLAILIVKLRNQGYVGNLLKLIEFYFQDRIQVVNIIGYRSRAVNISFRVLRTTASYSIKLQTLKMQ